MPTLKITLLLACDLPKAHQGLVGDLERRHLTSQQAEDLEQSDVYIVVDPNRAQVMKAPHGDGWPKCLPCELLVQENDRVHDPDDWDNIPLTHYLTKPPLWQQ